VWVGWVGGAPTGGGAEEVVAGGIRPTSAGTGGGRSLPSRAGREMIPAITAAAIAAARPTLRHLICRPATYR
jgi:hypothetical protein